MSSPSSSEQHHAQASTLGPIPIALVTVSDTRTPETDVNRQYLTREIEKAGHTLIAYRLLRDEPADISAVLEELVSSEARILLFNGGTGISTRDTTYDTLAARLEKVLPGFGEIFRMLSYQEIGAAAMLSRAVAGVYRGRVIVSLPGSPSAVRLAWEKLLLPEISHLAWEVAR